MNHYINSLRLKLNMAKNLNSKKDPVEEEFVFEFYDEDYADSLEIEKPEVIEEYNDINFEEDLNDEQLEIINNIKGPMLVIAG
ncbi:unnamed protein product, partial [marine sediment metagenome]